MAITYLGEVAVTHDGSAGGMTVSLTSLSLQQDDVVVVGFLLASNTDRSIGVNTAGYTEEAELFANDTYDANLSVSWKRMGSTPDSSVDVSGPGSSTHPARIIARGYRGVDTTTAMDVARTTATGTNGLLVDPPSITPTTSGALIVAWGCGAANAAALSTAYSSSDLTDFTSGIVSNFYDLAYGVGHKSWTSGAFDAAAWTGTETATTDSRASVVLALRPATASGVTGTASDTVSVTGSAAGTVKVAGAGADTVSVTGSSAGTVLVVGAATDTVAVTGAATGVIGSSITGTASDTVTVTGAAAGAVAVAGAATDTVSVVGSSAGTVLVRGAAADTVTVTGAASGLVLSPVVGTAADTVTISGAATAINGGLSSQRARYPAASANTVTVHSETRQSALIGTTRTVRIV